MERAEKVVSALAAMDGPENDKWWMAVVCDPDTGEVFGDVGAELSWKGRSAEVGYTFAKEHWGKGYAAEAVEALVRYLFEELGRDEGLRNASPRQRGLGDGPGADRVPLRG